MQNLTYTLALVKKLKIKILSLNLMILSEYQNIKNALAKGYVPNWSEEAFTKSNYKS